jgi:GH15 family glucan-1,4-alpha-glucosidase
VTYWQEWLSQSRYDGRWREMVHRSALCLKLLVYQPTGALVAAPTTSLPEAIGHGRNWDYRYTWIRDAAFTVSVLMRLGFVEEAAAFMDWLEARCRECPHGEGLQTLYRIDGSRDLEEEALDHLAGYRGSRPVRVGNGAAGQLQLDIYGEVMDAVAFCDERCRPVSWELWTALGCQLDWLAEHWTEPDHGIWEPRIGRQQFTHSTAMTWVAFDRALRIARRRGLPGATAVWSAAAQGAYRQVQTDGWNPVRRSYVQFSRSDRLDASLLVMPMVGFLGANDPRFLATLDAIEQELVADQLVRRYADDGWDGLEGTEGSFSLCSFWLVDALARAGRVGDARLTFEKMLTFANHLGLYAEQIGPSGEALGNFPQAFTHLALINAALELNRRLPSPTHSV